MSANHSPDLLAQIIEAKQRYEAEMRAHVKRDYTGAVAAFRVRIDAVIEPIKTVQQLTDASVVLEHLVDEGRSDPEVRESCEAIIFQVYVLLNLVPDEETPPWPQPQEIPSDRVLLLQAIEDYVKNSPITVGLGYKLNFLKAFRPLFKPGHDIKETDVILSVWIAEAESKFTSREAKAWLRGVGTLWEAEKKTRSLKSVETLEKEKAPPVESGGTPFVHAAEIA
jgi:hypothetical protein